MRLSLATLAGIVLAAQPLIAEERAEMASRFTPSEIRAAKENPEAFTIDPESIEIVNLGPAVEPATILPPAPGEAPQDPFVVIDKIINTAKKIWDIIEKNKPVVDVSTTYANAVPEGITHWSQLNSWRAPAGTIYGFRAKNVYGVEVVNVRYQVLRTVGGNYKGKGKYLTAVTVVPLAVDVLWGYDFKMSADVPSTANMGTSEDPLASMILNLKWRISTAIKNSQGTSVYYVQGDGQFHEIGGPFKKQEAARLSRSLEGVSPSFN